MEMVMQHVHEGTTLNICCILLAQHPAHKYTQLRFCLPNLANKLHMQVNGNVILLF